MLLSVWFLLLGLNKPVPKCGDPGGFHALGGAAEVQLTETPKPSFAFISCHSLKGKLVVHILWWSLWSSTSAPSVTRVPTTHTWNVIPCQIFLACLSASILTSSSPDPWNDPRRGHYATLSRFPLKRERLISRAIKLSVESCLAQGHGSFSRQLVQRLIIVNLLVPPGITLKVGPRFRAPNGVSWAFLWDVSQPSFSPCPILLLSLPF